jgi:hypothetical protein
MREEELEDVRVLFLLSIFFCGGNCEEIKGHNKKHRNTPLSRRKRLALMRCAFLVVLSCLPLTNARGRAALRRFHTLRLSPGTQ